MLGCDIKMLCKIALVSRSGYYKWISSLDIDRDKEDYLLINKIFNKGKKKLGWRPIQMCLKSNYGVIMNHKKIKRIMRENYLIVKIRRKNPYRMMAKKTQLHCTFDNILNRDFHQVIPGKVLCTDITYIDYSLSQKAYLSVIKDIASKEILSWKLSNNLSMDFVLNSIAGLKNNCTLTKDALIHSDQGFHYTSPEYIQRIKSLGLTQSMSRKGNCIDNAPIESFFGHLKDDIDHKEAMTFDELNDMIDAYMDYYNNHRYQWEIKKMTPVEYKNHLLCQLN